MRTDLQAINVRYSELATSNCCLSCGGAINQSEPKTGEVCLDLGSGRGTDVLRLAELAGESGFAYGIDISDGMIKKAQRNAQKLNAKNVEFIKSDLDAFPLKDNSVDLIISNCTINHAKNKQAVWNEVHRVLKPGGRVVVSDIYATVTVSPEYADDPQAVAECWGGSVTKKQYLLHLQNAGFQTVTILEESDPYPKGAIEVASFTLKAYKP